MEIVAICFILLLVWIIVSVQLKKAETENKKSSNYKYRTDYQRQPISRETRRNIVENMRYSSDNKKDEVELVVNLNIKSQTDLQKAEKQLDELYAYEWKTSGESSNKVRDTIDKLEKAVEQYKEMKTILSGTGAKNKLLQNVINTGRIKGKINLEPDCYGNICMCAEVIEDKILGCTIRQRYKDNKYTIDKVFFVKIKDDKISVNIDDTVCIFNIKDFIEEKEFIIHSFNYRNETYLI